MNNVQWRKVKLGEVAKTFTGLTYSPNCIDKSGTLVLRSSNIKDGQLCFEDNVFVSMDIPERAIVQENDILICVRNGSRNLIGKCALITKDAVGMAFGAFMTVLRTNIIDPKLLLYIWQSNNIQRQVANNIGATINQITNADFNRFEISYPESLSAQRRIAAILASADKVIAATQKTIAKYKQIKQGMMEDLLKPKEGWKKVRLGEVVNVFDGTHQTPYYVETGIPFYSVENVTGNDFEHTKYITEEEHSFLTQKHKIEKGDILMTRIGSIGVCKFVNWNVNASFYVSLALLKIKEGFDAEYLVQYSQIEAFKKSILHESLTFAYPQKINLGDINNVEIAVPYKNGKPDLAEQRRIAAILSGIDAKIAAEEKVLQKYEKVKKGLMERLLEGGGKK